MRVALVDMDGTLIEGRAYEVMLRHLWVSRWRRARLIVAVAAGAPTQLLRKTSPGARVRNQRRWAANLAWLFGGAEVSEVQRLMRGAFSHVESRLRPEMVAEVRRRRKEGFRVVVVSTSIQPVVEAISEAVGVDACLGTPLAIRDGRYSGRLGGRLCSGEGKIQYVQELARRWGAAVRWEESYAYSDGHPDLPMLEHVGNPVTVHPDSRLAEIARQRGWPSLDLRGE
ncbi:MAG: HAD family phosphatase [Bacillota bacterium]